MKYFLTLVFTVFLSSKSEAFDFSNNPNFLGCLEHQKQESLLYTGSGGSVSVTGSVLINQVGPNFLIMKYYFYNPGSNTPSSSQCGYPLITPDPPAPGSGWGSGGNGGPGTGGSSGGPGRGANGDSTAPSSNNSSNTSACGSIINYAQKTVDEQIPLDGVPFYLNYSSFHKSRARLIEADHSMVPQISYTKIQVTVAEEEPIEVFASSNPYKNLWDTVTGNTSSNIFTSKVSYEVSFIDNVLMPIIEPPLRLDIPTWSFSKKLTVYNPEVWGLGGWTFSIHHYFDHESKTLFRGDGTISEYVQDQTLHTTTIQGVTAYIVPNKLDPNEYFIFNGLGQHLETRLALTNTTKYKFNYAQGYKLTSIEGLYGKTTQLIYDTENKLTKIVAPYGQETLIQMQNDRIVTVTNSLQKSHHINYFLTTGLISSFQDLTGVITSFEYNAFNELTAENKNTGFYQKLLTQLEEGYRVFKLEHPWGIAKKVLFSFDSGYEVTYRADNSDSLVQSEVFSKDAEGNPSSFTTYQGQNSESIQHSPHPLFGLNIPLTTQTTKVVTEEGITSSETQHISTQYSYIGNNPLDLNTIVKTINYSNDSHTERYVTNAPEKYIWYRSPLNHDTYWYFNEAAQITRIEAPFQEAKQFTYNQDGQLIKIETGSDYENYTYDTKGYVNQISNSKNQITSFMRDSQGKVLTQTSANGEQTHYEYTDAGDLKKITTSSNQVHYFQMGLGDFLQKYITPNNKQTGYVYDTSHRLIEVTKPSGKTLEYTYSPINGLLSSLGVSSGVYSYEYDAHQRLQAVNSADGIRLEHKWFGSEIKQQKWYDTDNSVIATLDYNFEENRLRHNQILLNSNEIASLSYFNGLINRINEVNYSFRAQNQYFEIESWQGSFSAYYQNGKDPATDKPMQTIWGMGKDGDSEPLRIYSYRHYDNFGHASSASSLTINSNNETLQSHYELKPEYDANDRLIQVQRNRRHLVNNQEVLSVDHYNQYDFPIGSNNNLKEFRQKVDLNSTPQKRTIATHSNDDQLLTLRGSINRDYLYNDDGDLKSMTNCYGSTQYEYDVFSNLKKVTLPSGKIIEYKVDGMNRRLKKLVNGVTSEYYLWYDQTRIAAILDENKETKIVYLYGPEIQHVPSYVVKNGVSYRILHDPGLGSIRYIINPSTREIVQEIEYDEYGNMIKNTNPEFQPLTFAGGLWDSDTRINR
ncbi:RHS repeat protein [Pseudobdellovibrio exovorus]|uniref:Teneurin-like YD-shell domain-containing protein n=1 Tax=Pseudobdellovibrio exovorus JSS TaxID=1184267 RepID=M4VAB3_9BACT|nr:RHS repeat protein [Pseudobdellovibrio exovorus]AGH96347.1 hypothetical protein A11Q_2131 [Pseudobdellovibrio exovorus JSS]